MPNIINMTVKKADGTTDITYESVVPSSGSNSPAIWRSPVGAAAAHRAELRVRSTPNAQNTVRRVEVEYVYPETAVGSDGKVSVVNRFRLQTTATVPRDMADTLVLEAVAQGFNLLAHAHSKAQHSSGYAST